MPKPPTENEVLVLLFIGVSFIVTLAASIIFFVLFYQRKLIKHKLMLQAIENEHQRKIIIANIETQEQERNRIAKDLHDDVGATLSTANFFLGSLQDSTNLEASIQEIEGFIANAAHKLRSISHNITPKILEEFGLVRAIEDIRIKLNSANTLFISFDYNTTERFETMQELNLYRIAQELLNNTIKHAQASKVQIKLYVAPDKIEFSYKDDGIGVDIKELTAREKMSLGMSNLFTRAEALRTKIRLESAQNQGFYAYITFKPNPAAKK
jgi:signal transduction histidine kinase